MAVRAAVRGGKGQERWCAGGCRAQPMGLVEAWLGDGVEGGSGM